MLDGVFINLSRSDARRAQMEVQLADCHSSDFIKRFAATDGSVEGPFENSALNGAWACRRSHENVINFASNLSATVVLEDDVELSGSFSTFINEAVVSSFVESNENCDILFLECCPYSAQVPFLLSLAEKQMSGRTREDLLEGDRYIPFGLNIVDAKGIYAYSTASYIVTPKGKRHFGDCFRIIQARQRQSTCCIETGLRLGLSRPRSRFPFWLPHAL
ncbi:MULTISPECIES: hypothetical protein [unclassified Caballeronia]|uniref:hypothetical protein n=1 Tax=unclassified Caballeronia TaxID=2646786 RepID=UPI001F25CE1C|nr:MULTISPECIES: hypothetical protein [unclassified Caballeronia]MCE4542849.1 hypothetical protein [Caballeronia sp. PC1]MCE4568095.1 hypothetical protein [Caballeronia sp. CLC5]